MASYCTCTNLKCPLHPTNHDKGCTPCIRKNLRLGEVPNCFFHLVLPPGEEAEDSSLEAFALQILAGKSGEPGKDSEKEQVGKENMI